jgi:hypothetical protein
MASSKDNKRAYGQLDQDEEAGEATIVVSATPVDDNGGYQEATAAAVVSSFSGCC